MLTFDKFKEIRKAEEIRPIEVTEKPHPVRKAAEWANFNEIAKSDGIGKVNLIQSTLPGGIPLYMDGRDGLVSTETVHMAIVGKTGTGKSRCAIMPMGLYLANSSSKESCVFYDVKGELYAHMSQTFKENGYDVYSFDLRNPWRGSRINPLATATKLMRSRDPLEQEAGIREMADILGVLIHGDPDKTDDYWFRVPYLFVLGLAQIMVKRGVDLNLATLSEAIQQITASKETVSAFRSTLSADDPLLAQMDGILSCTAKDTLSGFRGYLTKAFDVISSHGMIDMTSGNDVDFTMLGSRPTAVFIMVPDENSSNDVMANIILEQIILDLYRAALGNNGRLERRVNLIIDEFPLFPVIEDIGRIMSACRSRNIRMILGAQTLGQFDKYENSSKAEILNNIGIWMCTGGADPDLANRLSNEVGRDIFGHEMVDTSVLRMLEYGHPLVICGKCNPFISKMTDVSEFYRSVHVLPYLQDVREPLPEIVPTNLLGRLFMTSPIVASAEPDKTCNSEMRDSKDRYNWDEVAEDVKVSIANAYAILLHSKLPDNAENMLLALVMHMVMAESYAGQEIDLEAAWELEGISVCGYATFEEYFEVLFRIVLCEDDELRGLLTDLKNERRVPADYTMTEFRRLCKKLDKSFGLRILSDD
ncbi:type IV secretory system conjugative DNA transfer family protein [Methanomethylophilus alvi]|uniref:type IV secretory system conjugative DNA transfer family protein n=1 Tax=Methanomethylophilus alvi TaxID=1291540 RepID=UPI0037DCF508